MRRAAPSRSPARWRWAHAPPPSPAPWAIGGSYRAEVQNQGGSVGMASVVIEEDGNLVRVTLTGDGAKRTFTGTSSLSRASSLDVSATRGSNGTCGGSVLPAESLFLNFSTGDHSINGRIFRPRCEDGLPREDSPTAAALRLLRR